MRRTLIVATTSYAGMGPYVSEIVNTFSPEDDVYFFFHDYEDDFFKKNVKKELHGKSVFYREANSAVNKLKSLIFNKSSYDGLIFKLCREKNIELVHYINGIPSIAVQKRMENMGIIVLSTVHDLEQHDAKKAWYKMLRHEIIYRRLKENLLEAKYLVTNSMGQYEKIRELYPDKELTYHSFPSLVTREIIDGKDVPAELKKITKPYILFFGRIEEYKGIHLLYKAFMECKDLQEEFNLVIAGGGQVGFERLSNDDNVIFINRYIKDSEIAYLYKNASCVVYPYISATQSGVLSVAFYYQRPVLASDVPFFKGIIEKSGTGLLFKAGNVEDLKKQLHALVSLDACDMKSKQQDYYENNYNGISIRANLLKIYAMEWTEKELDIVRIGGVTTRRQMKAWIAEDFKAFRMQHPLAARFTYGENWELFSYMRNLRHLEYYTNKPRKMPWDKILRFYYWLRHRRNIKCSMISIAPNCVGPGFHLQHRGFRHILSGVNIGKNCEMLPMVLIGKKLPDIADYHVNIGDNCYISTGVTILAPVEIGKNVTIAAGAVVTKDVPDNAVVAGVPARIVKIKK